MSEHWEEEEGALKRTFTFDSYRSGVEFSVKAAEKAEEMDHHPTITINYAKVDVTVTTHDQGNIVTEKDRRLAQELDAIYVGAC